MKQDILNWAQGKPCHKRISKETLNHRELIEMVSGIDIDRDTPAAFLRAYEALGIDLINRVPKKNTTQTELTPQQQKHKNDYAFSELGVYDTAYRHRFLCENPDQVWDLDAAALSYEELITPVPHPCSPDDIQQRQMQLGNVGLYYPMLYTTVFMWAVEMLGWENFMLAAIQDPDRFHDHFIAPLAKKSETIVRRIAQSTDNPLVFVHDDLADANGLVFPPAWYDDYILPHYDPIIAAAAEYNKKVVLVADGNMSAFLGKLVDIGFVGIMCENPATPLDTVLEHFGQPGQFVIGGIDTAKLTTGTPDEIRQMVLAVDQKCENHPGFAISSCGGLHGNIAMENLIAYFDARSEIGSTPKNWKTCFKERQPNE